MALFEHEKEETALNGILFNHGGGEKRVILYNNRKINCFPVGWSVLLNPRQKTAYGMCVYVGARTTRERVNHHKPKGASTTEGGSFKTRAVSCWVTGPGGTK